MGPENNPPCKADLRAGGQRTSNIKQWASKRRTGLLSMCWYAHVGLKKRWATFATERSWSQLMEVICVEKTAGLRSGCSFRIPCACNPIFVKRSVTFVSCPQVMHPGDDQNPGTGKSVLDPLLILINYHPQSVIGTIESRQIPTWRLPKLGVPPKFIHLKGICPL